MTLPLASTSARIRLIERDRRKISDSRYAHLFLFGLNRVGITRWPRESRRRGRPRRGRFRHAPALTGLPPCAATTSAWYGATTPWLRSARPTSRLGRVEAIRSRARSSCLGGARQCWCGRYAPGRRPYLLRSSHWTNPRSCSAERPCWVWIASRAHRLAMAFSPASVNFNEYAWPVSSSPRQASFPAFALISRARPAVRSLVATFCAAAAFWVFGGMRQRSLRCDASDKIASCVSVVWQGNSSGSSSRVWRRCRRHHREPRTGDEPGGAEELTDQPIGGSILSTSRPLLSCGPKASEI